jgi:uncharacterized membrane protein YgdD (TMEM256/DUF423 family)
MLTKNAKVSLFSGTALLALAVLIGAFGAHGLKSMVDEARLTTFETGVRYHFYHAFGLVLFGLFQTITKTESKGTFLCFIIGILLFSLNCYLYFLTGSKIFSIIVTVGGVSFVVGWILFSLAIVKQKN